MPAGLNTAPGRWAQVAGGTGTCSGWVRTWHIAGLGHSPAAAASAGLGISFLVQRPETSPHLKNAEEPQRRSHPYRLHQGEHEEEVSRMQGDLWVGFLLGEGFTGRGEPWGTLRSITTTFLSDNFSPSPQPPWGSFSTCPPSRSP